MNKVQIVLDEGRSEMHIILDENQDGTVTYVLRSANADAILLEKVEVEQALNNPDYVGAPVIFKRLSEDSPEYKEILANKVRNAVESIMKHLSENAGIETPDFMQGKNVDELVEQGINQFVNQPRVKTNEYNPNGGYL